MQLRAGPRLSRALAWPTYVWLAACFYLLLGLGVSDLVAVDRGTARRACRACARGRGLGATAFTLLFGMWNVRRGPELQAHRSPRRRLAGGARRLPHRAAHGPAFRLADSTPVRRTSGRALSRARSRSDRHHGRPGRRQRARSCASEVAPLAALSARDGVFFVTGNHDHYSGAESWVACVRELGIEGPAQSTRVDRARASALRARGRRGLLEPAPTGARRKRRAGSARRQGRLRRPSSCSRTIPRSFERAREHAVELQLSGHTHGGQMWPFALLRSTTNALRRRPVSKRSLTALRQPRHGILGASDSPLRAFRDHGAGVASRRGMSPRSTPSDSSCALIAPTTPQILGEIANNFRDL